MAVLTEVTLRLPNSPGALAAICRVLADERISILALSLESGGQLRLVVDNIIRAEGALRDRHYKVAARDVLVVSARSRAWWRSPRFSACWPMLA